MRAGCDAEIRARRRCTPAFATVEVDMHIGRVAQQFGAVASAGVALEVVLAVAACTGTRHGDGGLPARQERAFSVLIVAVPCRSCAALEPGGAGARRGHIGWRWREAVRARRGGLVGRDAAVPTRRAGGRQGGRNDRHRRRRGMAGRAEFRLGVERFRLEGFAVEIADQQDRVVPALAPVTRLSLKPTHAPATSCGCMRMNQPSVLFCVVPVLPATSAVMPKRLLI